MMDITQKNAGTYSLIATIIYSSMLVLIFAALSLAVNHLRDVKLYSYVDIVAWMLFFFIVSFIVFASIWPRIIEKRA